MFLTVFGVGNTWGSQTDVSTITSSSYAGLSKFWSADANASDYEATRGAQWYGAHSGTTFTATGYANVSSISIECARSGSGAGTITITAGSSSKSITSFNTTKTTETLTLASDYTGTITIEVDPSANSLYLKSISVTYTPVPHTVNFSATSGTPGSSSLTEASGGAGVTLPNVTPTSAVTAAGWKFYGWATSAVGTETTTAPTIVGKYGDTYYPEEDITLYAVYAKGEFVRITSTDDITSGCKYLITAYYDSHNRIMTDSYAYVDIGGGYKDYRMAEAVLDETSTNKYSAASIYGQWCYTISGSAGAYFIQDVVNATNNYIDTYYTDWYNKGYTSTHSYVISFTSETCSIKCALGSYPYLVLFAAGDFGTTSSEWAGMRLYKAATDPKYASAPCTNIVTLSAGTKTNVSAITISEPSLQTCSSTDGDREVTITVTPSTGYVMKSGDELTWTKSSGTIPAAPTLVSGPTLNAGKYEFVYRFAQNDNGAGTFGATASTYTNYRTLCCDPSGLAFDGEHNYQTLVRQDIAGAHGGNGSATEEQGKATLVLDYDTESSGTCTVEVKKLTGGDNRSTAAAGSDCSNHTTIAVDGTNKKVTFEIWTYAPSYPTANGQGTYRIKLSQATASTYCATDVYYFVDVTLRDKFVDAVNGNSTINVDGQSKSSTDYYKTPAESDMDADLNDDCNSTTRRLIGWIKETDLETVYGTPGKTGYLEDASGYSSYVIAPYADFITSGCTWYAVWGVDNTPAP